MFLEKQELTCPTLAANRFADHHSYVLTSNLAEFIVMKTTNVFIRYRVNAQYILLTFQRSNLSDKFMGWESVLQLVDIFSVSCSKHINVTLFVVRIKTQN